MGDVLAGVIGGCGTTFPDNLDAAWSEVTYMVWQRIKAPPELDGERGTLAMDFGCRISAD